MAKQSSHKSQKDDFHLKSEESHAATEKSLGKITQEASMSEAISKIISEGGLKESSNQLDDDFDLSGSLEDMIKFTEIITRRKLTKGSQNSLKTLKSQVNCGCLCHGHDEIDSSKAHEKTQTESLFLNPPIEAEPEEETQEENEVDLAKSSAHLAEASTHLEAKIEEVKSQVIMSKSSAQLLKQLYTELKVCRCFEKYANKKKAELRHKEPSHESLATKEEVQKKENLEHEVRFAESTLDAPAESLAESKADRESRHEKQSLKSVVEEVLKHGCKEHCPESDKTSEKDSKAAKHSIRSTVKPIVSDFAAESDKESNIKKSEAEFVDVDLSKNESRKSESLKKEATKEARGSKASKTESFIKRLSDPFTRRSSKKSSK